MRGWVRVLACAAALAFAGAGLSEAQAARNRHLAKAKKAYNDLDYGKVLPLLKKALKVAKGDKEKVEIYELMAIIHATYNRDAKAQSAFIEVVKRQKDYELPPDTSPKIKSALEQARAEYEATRSGGEDEVVVEEGPEVVPDRDEVVPMADTELEELPVEEVNAEPVEEEDPGFEATDSDFPMLQTRRNRDAVYKKWWFWTIIGGVIVAGAGGYGIYALSQAEPPPYDLGPVPLK